MQPVLEEVFFGGPSGSWLIKPERRDRLKSRGCKTLATAVLASTHPDMFSGERAAAFRTLADQCLLHAVRRRLLQLRDVGGRAISTSSSRAS